MKELSIEQKARRYDEAIKRIENIKTGKCETTFMFTEGLFEHIFPELAESEDERIIKFISNELACLRATEEKGSDRYKELTNAIAWLEKQGKETSWKPSKEEMDVLYGLAYITNQYDEHKEEVITRLYQDLKREFFNGSSYENMFPNTEDGVRRRSTIQVLEYARSLDAYNQYGKVDIDKNIAWLEKQGEQQDVSIQINPSEYINDMGGNGCYLKNTTQASAWSEEDENMLRSILDEYKSMLIEKRNWLKSLKERYTWKPSDEQMELLREVQQALLGKDCHNRFVNFMYELKRLREE